MAWSENIHIHIHDESQNILAEILVELKKQNNKDDVLIQEIMDKLNAAIADIKSTIKN